MAGDYVEDLTLLCRMSDISPGWDVLNMSMPDSSLFKNMVIAVSIILCYWTTVLMFASDPIYNQEEPNGPESTL